MTDSAAPDADVAARRRALEAIQVLSDSMDRMHGGLKSSLGMNASDVAALRMLVIRERRGLPASPHDIAEHLQLSSASVSVLLDRLADAGHVRRVPHPEDRRSRVVELTDLARASFHEHFGDRLRAMRSVLERRDAAELELITGFLDELAAAMDRPLDSEAPPPGASAPEPDRPHADRPHADRPHADREDPHG